MASFHTLTDKALVACIAQRAELAFSTAQTKTPQTQTCECVCVCSHTCTHILNLHKSHYLNGVKLKRTYKNNHTLKLN